MAYPTRFGINKKTLLVKTNTTKKKAIIFTQNKMHYQIFFLAQNPPQNLETYKIKILVVVDLILAHLFLFIFKRLIWKQIWTKVK